MISPSSINQEKKWPSPMHSPDTPPEDAPEIHLDISINHVYITEEKKQDYQEGDTRRPHYYMPLLTSLSQDGLKT